MGREWLALVTALLCACRDASEAPDAGAPAAAFGELSAVLVSEIPQSDFAVSLPSATPGATYGTLTARAIAVGDLDGDGFPDLFVAPSFQYQLPFVPPALPVQVWLNHGDGTFYDGTSLVLAEDAARVFTGRAPWPWLADFNGDGRLDVFISDGSIPDADGHPAGANKLLLSGADGRLHDASSTLPIGYGADTRSAWVGDLDGDGCQDVLVTTDYGVETPGGSYILVGDCHGTFRKVVDGLPAQIAEVGAGARTPDQPYFAAETATMADFDGDGQIDLAICGTQISQIGVNPSPQLVFLRNDHLTFTEAAPLPEDHRCVSLVAGDIDGDGRPDVVVLLLPPEGNVQLVVLHNDGDFHFSDVTSTALAGTPGFPHAIDLRDADGDGHVDLVERPDDATVGSFVGESDAQTAPFLFLNDGHGQLAPWRFTKKGEPATLDDLMAAFPAAKAPSPDDQVVPLVFDANGDGVNDLVFVSEQFRDADPRTPDNIRIYTILAPPVATP